MAMLITSGAMMTCSFGAAPSVISILPTNRTLCGGPPAGNIMDHVPFLNIPPFAMCSSMANPAVASATAAAMGALTPMPCTPVTAAPWITGSPTVLIGNMPALNSDCKCMCSFGGMIQFTAPAQFQCMVP